MTGEKSFFSLQNSPNWVIILVLLVYTGTNFSHHYWKNDSGPARGVIKWDVISYYAYLPAVFIYGDLSLDFTGEPGFVNDSRFWYHQTENGGKLIITTMGLSFLYTPFFLMAHALAPVFGEPRSGFSSIYQFFLIFSALVYVGLGFVLLRKILLRYFTPVVSALTILLIGLGTNLYNYATYDAPMAHSYNFTLVIVFFYLTVEWFEKPEFHRTILLGLVFGMLTLIRPTNILVIVVFILWGVDSGRGLVERAKFLLRRSPLIGVMVAAFLLVWLPQFLYWKSVTGHFLYYSYGPHGDRFFLGQPHIPEILFSYRKGWFVYTPLMFFAVAGFFFLGGKLKGSLLPLTVYLVLMIYVQSCWWTWWFGGGFGSRVFIDAYGLLALPLGAFNDFMFSRRDIRWGIASASIMLLMMMYQIFQTQQYIGHAIHSSGMTKRAYWTNFLRLRPTGKYWQQLSVPDSELARKGIYVSYDTGEDISPLAGLPIEKGIQRIEKKIMEDRHLMKEISRYAKREGISEEEAVKRVAKRILEEKFNLHGIQK